MRKIKIKKSRFAFSIIPFNIYRASVLNQLRNYTSASFHWLGYEITLVRA